MLPVVRLGGVIPVRIRFMIGLGPDGFEGRHRKQTVENDIGDPEGEVRQFKLQKINNSLAMVIDDEEFAFARLNENKGRKTKGEAPRSEHLAGTFNEVIRSALRPNSDT